MMIHFCDKCKKEIKPTKRIEFRLLPYVEIDFCSWECVKEYAEEMQKIKNAG